MIGMTGPRNLHDDYIVLVSRVADTLRHNKTAVGCAGGLDKVYLASAPNPQLVEIFAAFGENGKGATRQSNVDGVYRAISRGATVHWWAGGRDVDLVQRLSNRSLAMVKAVATSKGKKGIVGFPNAAPPRPFRKYGEWYSCGSGTWGTIATAVSMGLPVRIFKCGNFDLSILPVPGKWEPISSTGAWDGCFEYVTA